MLARLRLAPEFQRADLGERDQQPNGQLDVTRFASVAQHRDKRRVLLDLVGVQRDNVPAPVRSDRGAVERKRDRMVRGDGERVTEPRVGALLGSASEHADRGDRIIGVRRSDRDEVRAAAARLDKRHRRPDAGSQSRICGRADRDRGLEIPGRQHTRRSTEPRLERKRDAIAYHSWREKAAVEEHGVRPNHQPAIDDDDGPVMLADRRRRSGEERREMAGNRDVCLVGQTELPEPRASIARGPDRATRGDR